GGRAAARAVAQYEAYATSLAFLRRRGRRGRAGADFAVRERELLHELWRRRELARPALEHAGAAQAWSAYGYGAPVPVYWQPYGQVNGQVNGQPYGHVYGPRYGPATPYPAYNPYRT
ncbi:PrsW family intramembrane metalloprotease, partial [Streptomyces sp. T21Q-yed]|nr:PrsW family intramembrane metalloprotease [Streptomyces sp. T21Q-yed]